MCDGSWKTDIKNKLDNKWPISVRLINTIVDDDGWPMRTGDAGKNKTDVTFLQQFCAENSFMLQIWKFY